MATRISPPDSRWYFCLPHHAPGRSVLAPARRGQRDPWDRGKVALDTSVLKSIALRNNEDLPTSHRQGKNA
jgi:hypothetical protein